MEFSEELFNKDYVGLAWNFQVSPDSCNNPDCSMFAGALFLNEPMTHGLLFGAVLILVGIRQVTI